jgi:uncharacterized protein YndB with AHSA1/START domain
MNDQSETRSVALEYDLPQAPAKVWRALTEPALLAKWLMTTDMQPIVGNAFSFKAPTPTVAVAKVGSWDGVVHCEVMEIEQHKRLRYSWRGGGLDTVVTWTLAATPKGGTLLRLEQSGFRPDKGQGRFFEGAKKGWQYRVEQRLPEVLAQIP